MITRTPPYDSFGTCWDCGFFVHVGVVCTHVRMLYLRSQLPPSPRAHHHHTSLYVIMTCCDRFEKAREALASMGVSVFSAAITTLGSALFLCMSYVLFFKRFGIFVVLNIRATGPFGDTPSIQYTYIQYSYTHHASFSVLGVFRIRDVRDSGSPLANLSQIGHSQN